MLITSSPMSSARIHLDLVRLLVVLLRAPVPFTNGTLEKFLKFASLMPDIDALISKEEERINN
jgi:hypothetical protein